MTARGLHSPAVTIDRLANRTAEGIEQSWDLRPSVCATPVNRRPRRPGPWRWVHRPVSLAVGHPDRRELLADPAVQSLGRHRLPRGLELAFGTLGPGLFKGV